MKRLGILLFIVLFAVTSAMADGAGAIIHLLLTRHGFIDVGIRDLAGHSHQLYVKRATLVGYSIGSFGRLTSASVSIGDPRDPDAYYAVGVAYLAVQHVMGKSLPLVDNPSALVRKGEYMLEAIAHNLRYHQRTSFRFDDMLVFASKHESERVVVITMTPR